MNMLKRTLAMMLVLCMLFTMAPITAFAEDTTDPAGTATPAADGELGGSIPDANQPDANQPAANQPDANQPDANQPAANQPAADQPAADQPAANQPAANQPAANQPAANQPAADQPAADQPAENQPAADQPAADQPAANQPDADQPAADQPAAGEAEEDPYGIATVAEDPYGVATAAVEPVTGTLTYASDYRILHLDCGRKYFTKDWIIALINEMEAAGYTHLELAVGNDNLRFLLNDMSVGNYTSAQVTAAIQAGNAAKHGAGELTQSEMDAIIAHAKNKGIGIIPLLNTPGHMYAIVTAMQNLGMSNPQFGYSASTVDVTNTEAVTFTQDLVKKYVDYFASQGCNEFNLGADEFANDDGNGQFSTLVNNGTYGNFIDYLNTLANYVVSKGMVPMAFNDGIYYNETTDQGTIHPQIMVSYWSSGWWAYDLAPADYLANKKGFKMINVNGAYYYILGKDDKWTPGETTTHDPALYTEAGSWTNSGFPSSNVSNPMGGMFCIWCDYPNFETETDIAANARMILRAMAAEMKGEDGTAVSDKVIPGGFNKDGTIAESCTQETVKNEATKVEVTGCGLTSVTAVVAEAPEIEGAAKVLAWDITPYAGEEKYVGAATVKLPVPADWNTSLVKGFYVENGAAVTVEGTYADGFYTFKMPHFSVGGVMLLDASTPSYNEEINLEVGGTHQLVIKNATHNGNIATNPPDIATVVAEYKAGEGTSETPVTSVNAGESYYLKNDAGQYMKADATFTGDISEAEKWTLVTSTNGYMIHNGNNQYLFYEGGWILFDDWGDDFKFVNGKLVDYYVASQSLIPVAGGGTVDQSTITFTGIAPGTTYATVGDTTYKIVVTEQVEITIKYQTEDGTVIKTETVNVADNATTYTVSNFNHNGKYYTVADTALTIDPKNTPTYTVTVTEVEEDLNTVTPLTIEYWQTNARVNAPEQNSDNTLKVTAQEAYSEAGLALAGMIPVTGYKGSTPVVYWRSRLLDIEDPQINDSGSDQTWAGIGFSKVRYWNGGWAVYADATETDPAHWEAIEELSAYQLVAYYMNDMGLADEVKVGTSDWADKGNVTPEHSNTGYNSIVFQVIYEGDTRFPADVTTSAVGDNSYIVHTWSLDNQIRRGVGTIVLTKIGDYNIWKVTAETGTHELTVDNTINSITWDGNERELFVDEKNPVSQYTIYNPSIPDTTLVDEKHENTYWDEENESILIRIYLSAEETKDSLKVIYYDEKFGASLAEFPISVPSGNNFNNNIVNVSTGNTAVPPVFTYKDDNGSTVTVADRVNAGGYGIVNALNKTQKFETNLANVAITNNRYSADLYEYTGSVISEDGKTITHYYSINQTALSPNYVADFGLPITFPLSDVVRNNIETVKSVTVNPDTLYGTLSYDSGAQQFVYTPTQVLPTIDVLTINITFDGTGTVTTNVGVTPATSVYYEENFLTYGANWSAPTAATKPQATEVLGDQTAQAGRTRNNYGYDPAYVGDGSGSNGTSVSTSTNGATASFTFTGTGFALYANCNDSTGYVTLTREGSTKKMYMMDTGLNYQELDVDMPGLSDDETTTDVDEAKPTGTFYNIPVITEKNLPYGEYKVTIYKTNNDGQELHIDGFRVYEPIDESGKTSEESLYRNDKEDKPEFYELRDVVLKSIGASGANSSQVYKDLGEGVEGLITSPGVDYPASVTLDVLLNNGPKNEIYLFKDQTLTFKVNTDRAMQIGLKAPNGATTYDLTCDNGGSQITGASMKSSVDMFYHVGNPTGTTQVFTVNVTNRGDKALAITDLKVCDDPNFSFVPLNEVDIAAILHEETEPEAPTYTMVELKGTDVFIDGTVFDYTGEAIEPAITVNVNGTQLVEGRDYTVTYTNNVQPGTATVTVRGIATASETLGYTGEVSIDYTINAPAEPEVPEETTRPTRPGKPEKPDNGNKPGENRPGNGNNKPGKPSADKNEKQKDAKLKITFVNLKGKKVASATLTKTGTANQRCVFSADEITANAPARRYAVWFFPVIIPYGSTSSIVVPVF